MSSPQLSFSAIRPTDRPTSYRRLVRAVDDACDAVGLGVAAAAAGVRDTDLRGMLDGRNGRRLPAEVAAAVADVVGAGALRDAITTAVRELFGLVEPESDRDYIHRIEGALLNFGAPGADYLARCRREARRG
jgi:hypothetical protein